MEMSNRINKVLINAPARLHLGFYNFIEKKTIYGGLGLAIEKPFVKIIVEKSSKLIIENKTKIHVDDIIDNIIDKLDIRKFKLIIEKAIPRHVGLGSTTQLSLSIALALTKLYNLKYNIRELATILGRGYVSGIGIGVFEKGGLIIDSGRKYSGDKLKPVKNPADLPYIIARYVLPKNWYFIIIIPSGIRGLREEEEEPILEKPIDFSKKLQYELYSTLLLELIPSIIKQDITAFGKALSKIQYITGKYFSKYQDGIFCCKESREIAKLLLKAGSYCVGQSSWGPAIYGLTTSVENAEKIVEYVIDNLRRNNISVSHVFISRPRNHGYVIRYY